MELILSEPNVTRQALIALIGNRTPALKSLPKDELRHWCSTGNKALGYDFDDCHIAHCQLKPIRVNGRWKIEVVGSDSYLSEFLNIVAALYKAGAPVYVKKPERYLTMLDDAE